ncbi:hypothetical protein VQ02_07125 [Methylobacterium variabile]|uniref:HTH tetR-type domain-containing protein n=1 Tax=Methylobacterium variabile TaxID=298794 RepID=A0A0J6SZW3_9HYPH|nr:TetR/AcrR family transcriptional regulator [Methylobacterium variabile]KMO40730.1 hypothetical protein VQ02_07125 [Methylobacterium variabile]
MVRAGGEAATRGDLTRARLRRAAAAVFARRGFHATKVSDIVREAGVSQPAFYIYFAGKEAAYDALVAEFREGLRVITARNLTDPATPRACFNARVALSFERFLDFMAADPDLTEIGFFQPPGCADTKARLVGWVAQNIVREQADGLFRTDVPADLIARCLVGLLEQVGRQVGRIEGTAAARRALAVHCAELFCDGSRPPRHP